MAKSIPMSKIWNARRLILEGKTVKEVSSIIQVSESVVRNYTKSERAKMK